MRYPKNYMDRILSVKIADVLNLFAKVSREDGMITAPCPLHPSSANDLIVDENRNVWFCVVCGEGGNVVSLAMKVLGCSFEQAVAWIGSVFGIEPTQECAEFERKRFEVADRMRKINRIAAEYYFRNLRLSENADAMRYLTDRGLTRETMRRFGLGYAGRNSKELRSRLLNLGFSEEELVTSGLCCVSSKDGKTFDRFRDRIMFPITDGENRVIAFGGRIVHDFKPKDGKPPAKYMNSPDTPIFDKGTVLYGMLPALRTGSRRLIVCEGYMDVIAMHQAGFENAVAGLGTALTDRNADTIASVADSVVLCYDSDAAGRKALAGAVEKLGARRVSLLTPNFLPYKDPDECIKKAGAEYFASCLAAAEPVEVSIAKKLTATTSGRHSISEIASAVMLTGSDADMNVRIANVSWALGIPEKDLKNECEKIKLRKMIDKHSAD